MKPITTSIRLNGSLTLMAASQVRRLGSIDRPEFIAAIDIASLAITANTR